MDQELKDKLPQAMEKWPSLKKFKDDSYVEVSGWCTRGSCKTSRRRVSVWLACSVTDQKKSHDGRETRVLEYVYAHPGLSQMRGSPAQVLAAIDEFAAEQDFLINVGEDKGGIVAGLIAREKPKVFVELGGYVGYSAILFGDAMRKAVAMALVDLAGLGDVVKVVVGPADESLRRLHAEGQLQTVDVLFLDHVEDLYESDLKVCESLGLLKPGALVVADNVVRPGAPEYRKYVRSHPGLDSHGVRGLIMPGAFEDELEVSRVKEM